VEEISRDERGVQITLGIGAAERVVLEIPSAALPLFLESPEQIFANKTVCVIGVVQRVRGGRLLVVVNTPTDIAIV
jgi:hypothetical protein